MRPAALVMVCALVAAGSAARADDDAHDDDAYDQIAEPLIGESVTDIDGTEPGEAEVDLTAMAARRLDASNAGTAELEAEVKLTHRLGVNLLIDLNGDDGRPVGQVVLSAGASYGLLHDYKRQFHLSLEANATLYGGVIGALKHNDFGAPYTVGLRAAWRHGWFTTRYGLGLALDGDRNIPLFAAVAFVGEWGRHNRRSFAGIDIVSDWSSQVPLTIAPEVALGFKIHELPMRVGLALPLNIGYRREDFSVGGLVRIVFEIEPKEQVATKKR